MAGPAVGLDEFGNQVDADGNVVTPVAISASSAPQASAVSKGFFGGGIPAFDVPGLTQRDIDAGRLKRFKSMTPEERASLPFLARKRGEDLMAMEAYNQEVAKAGGPLMSLPPETAGAGELMSVEGTAPATVPVTTEGTGPEVGTAAVVDNIPKDSDGNFIVSPTQFDQLIRRAQGGLSRGRAASLEAAGTVDYQRQADEMARAQGEAREKYEREMREYEALQERQQQALDVAENEMRMAEQELRDGTIDPNRAYGGVGGRVAAAFATALGAFAQGITGGKIPNTAMQIINSAIDRDIFAQKEEMRKRKDVLMNKNNIYAQMMKRFGDERIAEQAAINMGYKAAQMKIGELATRFKGAQQQAAAQQLIAQAENNYAAGNTKLAQLVQQRRARLSAGAKGTSEAKNLFGQALAEVDNLRQKFKEMGRGEAAWGYLMGMFGPEAQISFSGDTAAQYGAARYAVAQFVNKAFSGARGSDRDLAAVMARIPQHINAAMDKEKGLKLIADLERSLQRAAGEKGYLVEGDIARYYDSQKGGKAKTNAGLVTFQSDIDRLREEGK